ncbi:MAG TPA: efflux RND transporter permease subunit [Myxococcota bacterium]|nr:efflux RND transporter permease subunit [Myxococcota bacterium]
MNLVDLCIARPVLTLMLMLSLVVFGVLGYCELGVDQLPNMEFPVVTVTAQLPGASPETMEEDVTEVLEENLNTIAGLRSLRSTTTQGAAMITAEFELERDIDQAAQDVRDKVARARVNLPRELDPPVIDKRSLSSSPIIWLSLASERPQVEVTEYIKNSVKPVLETLPGVASTEIFGKRERAIRIWLDGDALRARGLAVTDVVSAIQREHIDLPAGRIESHALEYTLKTEAEFESVETLSNLIVADVGGARVRLGDVAKVEDGAEDERYLARFNGSAGAGIGILKQSRANTVEIANRTHDAIDELRKTLPEGMSFPTRDQVIDFSSSIRESVAETEFALVFGALLATLTVLLFLRRVRPTLVIGTSIPLSLVAAFGAMWVFGFTINTMTLLALALAVGVVIDDAIIVLENIERRREAGESPREAASNGARQIAFAATAATLSIAIVFLPVVFVRGIVGSFLREFGLTVAASVAFSLFVALTLIPMLAARMPAEPPRSRGVFRTLELGFEALERRYVQLLDWAFAHRAAVLLLALASFGVALCFGSLLGSEFFPPQDEGRVFAMFETPPGTSLAGTTERVKQAEKWMLSQPETIGLFDGVGISGPEGPGDVTQAVLVAILKPRSERSRRVQDIMVAAREAFRNVPGLEARVFDPTSALGGDARGELEFALRGNLSIDQLDHLSDEILQKLRATPGFVDLSKSLKIGLPELRIVPDREKCSALGVDARGLSEIVQAGMGGLDVAKFKENGHRYDIRVRLADAFRADPEAIGGLYVRTRDGGVAELRNLARIEVGAAPSMITRDQRQRSVTISANLEGIPVGEAIQIVRETTRGMLPEGASLQFGGSAQQFLESLRQFELAIGLAVLVIYMVLAAQFESLLHPLTVMLALPLAMVGAFGGLLGMHLFRAGMTINLFSVIGIILLMGLVTKNSILLVDFANELRARGVDKRTAMRQAAPVRMRPVLMTAVSMILGVLPAAAGVGPGAETRAPMAVATGAGMLSSVVLTLVVVPVFYVVLDDAVERVRAAFALRAGRAAPDANAR